MSGRRPSPMTYNRLETLSVSSAIAMLSGCRFAGYLRYIKGVLPLYRSIEAERGTAIHELLRNQAILPSGWETHKDLLRTENPPGDETEIELLIDCIEERYGNPPKLLPDYVETILPEHPVLLRPDGSFIQRRGRNSHAALAGTLDLLMVVNGGETVIVRDYKSGRVTGEKGELLERDRQLRFYAYAATRQFPDAQEVVLEKHYIRFAWGLRSASLPREEFNGVWNEVVRWVAPIYASMAMIDAGAKPEEAFPPDAGERCAWCMVRAHCPFYSMLPVLATNAQGMSEIEQVQKLAAQYKLLKTMLPKAEDFLRGWAEANGGIVVGDKTLDFVPTKGTANVDVDTVLEIGKDFGLTADDILRECGITKTVMDKLVPVTGDKDEFKARLKTAISYTPSSQFRWTGKDE